MSSLSSLSSEDEMIEKFKTKKLIKQLMASSGNGTSMITVIIPRLDTIQKTVTMLTDEYSKAKNIQSRVNRLSVESAILSVQQRLKLYSHKKLSNGLVIYAGMIMGEDGKEKQKIIDFEPFKPLNTSLYYCGSQFRTEPLKELISDDKTFGFIIIDGCGALFATLCGSVQKILWKYEVSLAGKTRRGGQSAARYGRIRDEKVDLYLDQVAESANLNFIDRRTNKCNVAGIILAGKANLKNQMRESNKLDFRVNECIKEVLDIAYGGEAGLRNAIQSATSSLEGFAIKDEQKILTRFLSEIGNQNGKFSIGLQETFEALKAGASEELIVWDEMKYNRYVYKILSKNNPITSIGSNNTVINSILPESLTVWGSDDDKCHKVYLSNYELVEKNLLLEWLMENYKSFGANLHLVSNRSSQGPEFTVGLGGIGSILRYKIDLIGIVTSNEDEEKSGLTNGDFNEDDFI